MRQLNDMIKGKSHIISQVCEERKSHMWTENERVTNENDTRKNITENEWNVCGK